MKDKLALGALLLLFLLSAVVVSCAPGAPPASAPTPSPSATPDLYEQAAYAEATVSAASTAAANVAGRLTTTAAMPTVWAGQTSTEFFFRSVTSTVGANQTATQAYFTGLTATVGVNQTAKAETDLSATASATKQAAVDQRDEQMAQLRLQSAQMTHLVDTWLPYVIALVVLALLAFAAWKFIPVIARRYQVWRDGSNSPVFIGDLNDRVAIARPALMGRSSLILHGGQAAESGGVDDDAARAKLAVMLALATLAANTPRAGGLRETVRDLAEAVLGSPLPAVAIATPGAPVADVIDGEIREASDAGTVADWITEAEGRLLLANGGE